MDNELLESFYQAQEQSRDIEEKLQIVEQQISELQNFKISLDELEKNKNREILASLGKGVYIKSDIKDEKLFVDVGSGVLIRKSLDKTKDIIEEQTKRINEMKMQLTAEKETISENMKNIIEEIEKRNKY